jgi:hypothetical protein
MMMQKLVERRLGEAHETTGRVCVSIAGISFSTVSIDPGMRIETRGATARFLVEEAEPQVSINAGWGELEENVSGKLLFDSGALWTLYRQHEDYLFRFTTPYFGATPYKVALFNRDFTAGQVTLHRPYFDTTRSLYPLDYPLDELLMLHLLAQGRGAELHSCGLVDEGGAGLLFLGQSGAGKTTTARLWEMHGRAEILSDDRIILRRLDGQVWMYGTPWHGEGELARSAGAPLAGIFFLRHGERNRLQALGRAEASARLFSCGFPTFYDANGLDFTLAFFDEVTGAVPCYELSFVPDETAVDFVRRHAT